MHFLHTMYSAHACPLAYVYIHAFLPECMHTKYIHALLLVFVHTKDIHALLVVCISKYIHALLLLCMHALLQIHTEYIHDPSISYHFCLIVFVASIEVFP